MPTAADAERPPIAAGEHTTKSPLPPRFRVPPDASNAWHASRNVPSA
jgi:hypothetical protein